VRIADLLDEFLRDGTQAKQTTRYIYRLVIDQNLKPFFGKLRASKLTTEHTKEYRQKRKSELIARKLKSHPAPTKEQTLEWERSAGATVNRELARLRSAFEYATKLTPPKVIRIPHFHLESEKDNVRKVVLHDDDYATLRDAFEDFGIQLLFIVSSHVGIRASELKQVKWDQVDLERKVISLEKGKTKNRDARSAPIFGDMVEYLRTAKQERDEFYPESPWVFSRAGRPIKDFREAWEKAIEKAGVPELHFHDLRRTAQRLMRRAGIDKITRMRIMGHKTDAMDIRYGVVEDDDIVEAGSKLDETFRTVLGHRNGNRNGQPEAKSGNSELLSKLSSVPEEKLKALIAILGV
jgi:integrase